MDAAAHEPGVTVIEMFRLAASPPTIVSIKPPIAIIDGRMLILTRDPPKEQEEATQ